MAVTMAVSSGSSPRPSTNERSIFKHVDREPLEVAQRRVAGAEVVDGQPHAEGPEVLQHLEPGRRVGHQRGLGDLEAQRRRLEAAPLERADHEVDEVGLGDLAGRQVHPHREVGSRGAGRRHTPAWRQASPSTQAPRSRMSPSPRPAR